MTTPYLSVAEFKLQGNIRGPADDTSISRALNAATMMIDNACRRGATGQVRSFHPTASPAARVFVAGDRRTLPIDDAVSVASIATDETGDGTYETAWAGTDWLSAPWNATDRPYTRVEAVESRCWPTSGVRPRVEVTATWGWAAVPDDIVQATQILAQRLIARRGVADLGIVNLGDSAGYIRSRDPDVHGILEHYMRRPVLIA